MEPSSKTFIVDHKITDGKNTIVTRYSDQKLAKEGARNNFPFSFDARMGSYFWPVPNLCSPKSFQMSGYMF